MYAGALPHRRTNKKGRWAWLVSALPDQRARPGLESARSRRAREDRRIGARFSTIAAANIRSPPACRRRTHREDVEEPGWRRARNGEAPRRPEDRFRG